MSGYVERRALLALFRNHPATAPGDRYNWKAHAEAKRQREMLLDWAATQPDETLLHCRNLGPVALRWIREQTGGPPSPYAEAFAAGVAAGVAAARAPDGTAEFVAFAVEYLVLAMPKGEDEPTVRAGRRILAALAAIDAIGAGEETP